MFKSSHTAAAAEEEEEVREATGEAEEDGRDHHLDCRSPSDAIASHDSRRTAAAEERSERAKGWRSRERENVQQT